MSKFLYNIPYLEVQDVNPDGSLKPHVTGGQKVLVMLQGNFCGYCTQAKPAFQELSQRVKCATVQSDGNTSEQQAYKALMNGVKAPGVPAFALYDGNGRLLKVHNGDRTANALFEFYNTL